MAQLPLNTYGGLVASVRPADLPDGASPRCFDVDFVTGRVMQRPGEQSAYSYQGVAAGPNPAFVAVDTPIGAVSWTNPSNILLNDGNFAVAALTGAQVLNIATIQVIKFGIFPNVTVTLIATFTTDVPAYVTGQMYSFGGLTTYTSLNGQILAPLTTATGLASNQQAFDWGHAFHNYGPTADTGTASITGAPTVSDYLDVTDFTFAVPLTQSITGVEVSLKGFTDAGLTATLQLIAGGAVIGTAKPPATLPGSNSVTLFGGTNDNWGAAITPAVVNLTSFGIRIQAAGAGEAFLDYITIKLYLTSGNSNFNYVHTFTTPTGATMNLALDAAGNWWLEDCANAPGELTLILSGTTPNSYGSGATVFNRAFVANSTLTGQVTGSDIPRQYNFENEWWDRITQVGPGAAPQFTATTSAGSVLTITAYEVTSNIVTLTYTGDEPTAGEVGTFSGLSVATFLNGQTLNVLGTGLGPTQFQVAFVTADVGSTSDSGIFTPQYTYAVTSITQPAQMSDPDSSGFFEGILWSAGPGSTSSGNTITVYYSNAFHHSQGDTVLIDAFNSGYPIYVYISNAAFGNGIWQVTSIGMAVPPGGAEYGRWYFTYQVPTANYIYYGLGAPNSRGYYQMTQGTVTTATPVPNLVAGNQVSIASASVPAWDGVYTIVNALNSGAFNITQTALSGGTATYTWTLVSGSAPAAGALVTVTNTLNANGILNVQDAVIDSASGTTSGTFTIVGFAASLTYLTTVEQGQATTAGTVFLIDPGAANVGSTGVNPIYGDSTGGTLTVVGASTGGTFPISPGTYQGTLAFITRNGLYTAPAPPVTFTVAAGANYVGFSDLPIGPPNVIGRFIILTEPGQNGVPGANFYTNLLPTSFTVQSTVYTSSSFLIPDNVTTAGKLTFSASVLLQGMAVDVQGNNLFNLVEIGNPAAIVQYAERTFYIDCQNKVQNFNNLSFDGGYLQPTGGGPKLPTGWAVDLNYSFPFGTVFTVTDFSIAANVVTIYATNTLSAGLNVVVEGLSTGTYLNGVVLNILTASGSQFTAAFTHSPVSFTPDSGTVRSVANTISLRDSTVFGNSLYVVNDTGSSQSIIGMITQSAFQNVYNVPILNPNGIPVPYSVRITARTPSGSAVGNIVVDLTDSNQAVYGSTLATYTLPLSSLTNQMAIYEGALTSSDGLPTIPSGLLLRVWGQNIEALGDYEIDRVEIFPTNQPVLNNTVLVSYINRPEQVDGSTGQLSLNSRSQDPVYGATVILDTLTFKKAGSIIETTDSPNYEPSQWTTREISQIGGGTVGPNAFSQGEDWDISLHKTGVYVYAGGKPGMISWELQGFAQGNQLWDTINWGAAQTFWLANDLEQRKFYIGVAMNTPNFWLPNAPTSTNPTQPNVVLLCNYNGIPTAQELEEGGPLHVTMFGSLKSTDMRRKWSIQQIASPYGGIVFDSSVSREGIYLGNGTGTGKIYRLVASAVQMTDDGTPIAPLYTTAGQPGEEMAQQLQLGSGQKYVAKWMANVDGQAPANGLRIRHFPNIVDAQYPVTAAFIPALAATAQNNIEWRAEVRGQRIFTEFSMNQSGTPVAGYFELGELMCEMFAHPWGGFRGVSS